MELDLNNLAEQYGVMISSLSRQMIKDDELAKEAAQEVWYEIIKSVKTFEGKSELSTWIYIIAKRTIQKYAKNEKLYSTESLERFGSLPQLEYNGPDDNRREWIREKCKSCLSALRHCLTNEARLTFIFRVRLELSYKQISEIMETKEENIRQQISRSHTKISNFLNNACPIYNPKGTCKCRINKDVLSFDLNKEYANLRNIIDLVDFFQKFDKKLPKKNYWEKILK